MNNFYLGIAILCSFFLGQHIMKDKFDTAINNTNNKRGELLRPAEFDSLSF